ncbi:MAG: hypothetical protein IJG99_01970, partial [Ruminococcus sp.]|nr:hypothetical protein [Ruminococcus sp.]
ENGEITGIDVMDADADYDIIFSAVSGSKSTGTLQPVQVDLTTVAEGSQYSFTMPANNVTVKAEFEEAAPAPAPVKLILNVGENGKVVMDNGTLGNATDASNITEVSAPINVADGSKIFIIDGRSANLVEGGSINIATGGEVSFYPSADNTGVITAIPDEGYVFVGWYNGNTLYSSGAALAYQNISEDITLTAKFERELFWKHSVTLGGDIGVNFYLNPAVLDTYTGAKTVTFTWDGNEQTVDVPATATADGYKVTCNVVAAEMAHKIHAVVKADGTALAQTDDYSVQDYAEAVYNDPASVDPEKPEQLKALAKAMLNYGAMAQTVFDSALTEHPDLPTGVVGVTDFSGITADDIAEAIKDEASDLNAVADQLGAKFYTSSLIYLSRNTLRLYFTPTTYPGEIPNSDAYDGSLSDYYYFVDHANIPAAELDNQQTFNVNGTEFTFSALDYAYAVVESTKMEPEQQNLAKALYLYNQAANAYFDAAPAPAENIVDLSTLEGDYEAQNNDVLTGTLSGNKKITIADGATVTLKDANITLSIDAYYAGITPLGDATILLEGANTVKGGYEDNPGIFVPENTTLTIDGTGSLTASSGGDDEDRYGCGIGGGFQMAAGNIVINGGTITANGGDWAAGIGSGDSVSCGNITITGGTITANGGALAAGIGSGNSDSASCGNITITGGTITANGGEYAAGIGSGYDEATCSNILITGGTITANGGQNSAGIGSGAYSASCGNIMIADTVTLVTATKGSNAPNSIGAGYLASCGTVTIAPGANVIQN